MAIRLKLALKNPKLRLAHKALIFAVTVWLLRAGEFGFWPIALFIVAAITLYATPLFQTLELAAPLLVLLTTTLLGLRILETPAEFWFGAAYFTGLFYLILGIKELAFVRRDELRRLLALGLTYPIFLMFFYYQGGGFFYRMIFLYVALVLLTKSVLKERFFSWLTAFLALEISWVVLFLPIGFLGQAGLVSVFYFTLLDIVYHALERALTKRKVMIHATLLVLLSLLIFLFARWGI